MSAPADHDTSQIADNEDNRTIENDTESHDPRPRKRRKYIAKAWWVTLILSVMSASVGKSNVMERRHVKDAEDSELDVCTRKDSDKKLAGMNSKSWSVGRREVMLTETSGFDQLCEQMKAMQEQITALTAAVHTLTQGAAVPTTLSRPDQTCSSISLQRPFRRVSSAKEFTFQGPTTSAFSFDLAKSSLQRRGIVERNDAGEDGDLTQEPSPMPSPPSPTQALRTRRGDPLWTIGKDEALRLCRVYEEEMGIMYPVLDLQQLLNQVEILYGQVGTEGWSEASVQHNGHMKVDNYDVHILRLVLACAITAEASGNSDLAMRLFEDVQEVADNCVWGPPDIRGIMFLTLVSIFYFQMDEEALAWRTIGIVERMCLEKGLHRRETLQQPAILAEGKERILRLFWSIYVLDMRWSFGTGMPFALEDTDIDPWLPEPEEKTPYLRVMIRYSRIAAKVWKFISAFNNTNEIKKDEMNYLDWQVLRWAAAIPDSLRLDQPFDQAQQDPRSIRRLRSLLYLRANQLRMLIYRPVLHSAAHIMRYPAESQVVVDLAKDTIQFITKLNETSDIYRLQQVTFNWFLVSALAVLFLAVSQTPAQFSAHSKVEFYMALELVKGFSPRSYVSRRLWRSIKGLRRLGPQLGLQTHQQPEETARTALDPDAGTAAVDAMEQVPAHSTQSHTTPDGAQMTQELMEWFEAVGNIEDQIMSVGTGVQTYEEPWQYGARMGNGYTFDFGGELSSLMKDCF
ncbi:fungal transcription factor regulatory middle homology region [Aspergillus parasiticus SU-1]|uniref:Fungal transcription factor regulatory middle homology region n=1 Tax=Aspergillus parasiticus (strain ATCC 56775 / NRRL 5862 / SRRC 143 / SU-1) TaxID=1403190 RepID=A0A0F0II82_ASPPU|nr:fungal transcription factor regulatory middle homology region [Aspergillus parasiticus SU-1]